MFYACRRNLFVLFALFVLVGAFNVFQNGDFSSIFHRFLPRILRINCSKLNAFYIRVPLGGGFYIGVEGVSFIHRGVLYTIIYGMANSVHLHIHS